MSNQKKKRVTLNKKNLITSENEIASVDIGLIVFSNDITEQGTVELLKMFYKGAFENTIGIARCKNSKTGNIESVLVGVDPEGGFYPLAKVLDPADVAVLQAPDGKGGYFDAGI